MHCQVTDNNNHVDVSSAAKPDGPYIGKRWRAVHGRETSRTVKQTDVCAHLPSRRTQYSVCYYFPSFVYLCFASAQFTPSAWWESQPRGPKSTAWNPRERTNWWAAEVHKAHHRSRCEMMPSTHTVHARYSDCLIRKHDARTEHLGSENFRFIHHNDAAGAQPMHVLTNVHGHHLRWT